MNRKVNVDNVKLNYLLDWVNQLNFNSYINHLYRDELIKVIKNVVDLVKSIETKGE
jgi:hypothetical protein